MNQNTTSSRSPSSPLHQPALHESGYQHSSGEAVYVDDLPNPPKMLIGWILTSPIARGVITQLDVDAARSLKGVHGVFTAADIPGVNDISPFTHDEPLLAQDEVYCVGQMIALIVAESYELCRAAEERIILQIDAGGYEPILSVREAIKAGSYHGTPHVMRRGDVEAELNTAPLRLSGEIDTGGQDHFYLETHSALVLPLEHDCYHVYSSTQHPSEVQAKVAEVLNIGHHQVVVEAKRMGGGFGGKETQGAHFGALAALAAQVTRRPGKIWLNRDQDMSMTGKRHPFYSTYDAGFDLEGNLLALKVESTSNGGWAADLSGAILDRCLFHLDNPYYVPTLRFEGRVAKTNLPSNTAFRGFGGPQGAVVVEEVMNRVAELLQERSTDTVDPADVKRKNFYGAAPRNITPYGQVVHADRSARIFDELTKSSNYTRRRQEIDEWNKGSPWVKRGIGYQAVKFGISFTASQLNQAGALVLIYTDGSVQLNHGGTEMGQGLHTKMLTICAHELGVCVDRVRVMNTATDKVPNTSATAASSGSDLNGEAVAKACITLKDRLRPVAIKLINAQIARSIDDHSSPPRHPLKDDQLDELCFEGGYVSHPVYSQKISFDDLVQQAYLDQISLSSTGYYRTPDISYDRNKGHGKPFHYFAYGGAVLEVEVNGLTGEHRLIQADILHDVGNSLIPTIDQGQIEGAFIQGLGWLTREELIFSPAGVLKTHSPDTYKIPAFGDAPHKDKFRVDLLEHATQDDVIHGSKAVGEPPFLLAIGVLSALRQAISSFASTGQVEALPIPCTPEAVLSSIEVARGHLTPSDCLARAQS